MFCLSIRFRYRDHEVWAFCLKFTNNLFLEAGRRGKGLSRDCLPSSKGGIRGRDSKKGKLDNYMNLLNVTKIAESLEISVEEILKNSK